MSFSGEIMQSEVDQQHGLYKAVHQIKPKTSKRGRKSAIPVEQREQVRRIKKQNMERRRRACISDKMNALHNLAMNLIGEDPAQYQKAEKADILNMCYAVFEHVVAIVKEQPDMRLRVQQLFDQFREKSTQEPIVMDEVLTASKLNENDWREHGADTKENHFQSHPILHSNPLQDPFRSESDLQNYLSHPKDSVLHSYNPDQTTSTDYLPEKEHTFPSGDSGFYPWELSFEQRSSRILPAFETAFLSTPCAIRMPLKHRLSNNKPTIFRSSSRESPTSDSPCAPVNLVAGGNGASMTERLSSTVVWRPYLD
ncbi:hypothetical protein EG68_04240 [Paragonimus skrjabini miyazakii]|uniref:BHLH domain-containing protein n=1 Tax=Paragonimus skrjabini miyazakii TaxID=59628 RepID=A0A8S9YY49_9TREM|nr:hypothetical protein EG68_04240 [Paragonimus skrjabini miyazakii]